MMIEMILRHIKEGIRNLLRNGWMTFASISSVAITLMILGSSLGIALNAERMSTYITNQLEIDTFLQTSVSDSKGQQIASDIQSLPGVKSVQFISKERGFELLKSKISNQYSDILDGLSAQNTLPVQIIVKSNSAKQILSIGKQISTLPGVARVNDGKAYVDKLLHVLSVLRNVGLGFVIALVLTAMFLISNTIKITIFARRREIEIMKLVGATNWFIRWPFLMEGVLIGAIGAVVPYSLLVVGYNSFYTHVHGSFFEMAFTLLPTAQLASKLAIVLFGIGVLIGMWGGIMSIRKFLRV